MMFIKSIIIVSLLLKTCSFNKQSNSISGNIKAIKVSKKLPEIDTNGTVINYTKYDTKMYFNQNQVLIQSYYYHAFINNPTENTIPVYNYYYRSFVYSKDKNYGLLFDSTDLTSVRVVDKDSMLKSEWSLGLNFNKLFKENEYRLLSSGNKDKEPFELFYLRNKSDTAMTGSVKLVFSRQNFSGIDYSLSKEIDSTRKMKLIGVIMVNDARYLKEQKKHIDRVEIPYTIERILINDTTKLKKLFEYEKNFQIK